MFLAAILFASLIYFVEQGEWDDEQGLWIYEGSSTADGEASASPRSSRGCGGASPRSPPSGTATCSRARRAASWWRSVRLAPGCSRSPSPSPSSPPTSPSSTRSARQEGLGGEGPQHILVGFRNTFLSCAAAATADAAALPPPRPPRPLTRPFAAPQAALDARRDALDARSSAAPRAECARSDGGAAAEGGPQGESYDGCRYHNTPSCSTPSPPRRAAPPVAAPAAAPPAAPTAAPAATPAAGVLGRAAATAAAIDRDADATPRATDPTIVNAGRHAELELALPRRSSRTSSTGTLRRRGRCRRRRRPRRPRRANASSETIARPRAAAYIHYLFIPPPS